MTSTNSIQNPVGDPDIIVNGLIINQVNITDDGYYLISTAANTAEFSRGFGILKTSSGTITVNTNDPVVNSTLVTTSTSNATWQTINIDQYPNVRVATTANILNFSSVVPGSSIDGVTLALNDRVLVKDTTNSNGVYTVTALGLVRSQDFSVDRIVSNIIQVNQGNTYSGTAFYMYGQLVGTQLKILQFGNKIISDALTTTTVSVARHIILVNGTYNLSSNLTISNDILLEGSGNTIITGSDIIATGNVTFKNIKLQNNITCSGPRVNFYNTEFNNSELSADTNSIVNISLSRIINSTLTFASGSSLISTNNRFIEDGSNVLTGSFITCGSSGVYNKINNCFVTSIADLTFLNATAGVTQVNCCNINSVASGSVFQGTAIVRVNSSFITSTGTNSFLTNFNVNNCIISLSGLVSVNGNNITITGNKFLGGILNVATGSINTCINNNIFNAGNQRRIVTVNDIITGTNTSLVIRENNFVRNELDITGTSITGTTASATITGTGTAFLTDFTPGDVIRVSGIANTVLSIASDTSLTFITNFTGTGTFPLNSLAFIRYINVYENVIDVTNSQTQTFSLPILSLQPGHKILFIRNASTTQNFNVTSIQPVQNIRGGGVWANVNFTTSNGWAIFEWTGVSTTGKIWGWSLTDYGSVIVT